MNHLPYEDRLAEAVADYQADVRRTLDAYEIEQIERQVKAEFHADAHGSGCTCDAFDEGRPADAIDCDGCSGDGIYFGRGHVENGKFKGHTGTCFRCGGKGYQTPKDVKRNRYYDNHVRRFTNG